MNTKAFLTTAAIAATTIAGMTGASAQTIVGVDQFNTPQFTDTVGSTFMPAAGGFNYSYLLTNTAGSIPVTSFTFDFGAAPVTFLGQSAPDFTLISGSSTVGPFAFFGSLPASSSDTFTFFSSAPPAPSGVAIAATGFGGGVFAGGGTSSTGPTAAPEPGSMVSLTVLGACLGMGILARRKSMSN